MKIPQIILMAICVPFYLSGQNQGEAEIAISVRNTSGKSIGIFAGPKEAIREPVILNFGGLSTNKVYVKLNDVVCLMNPDKTPKACIMVKPGVTVAEVNEAANSIVAK